MPKKSVTRRTPGQIDTALRDTSKISVREQAATHRHARKQAPSRTLGRVDAPADRLTKLKNYAPELSAASVAVVRDSVAALVMGVPYESDKVDRGLMGNGYRLATYCLHSKGSFDPDRDLQEDSLEAFRESALTHVLEGSQATYLSNLRRLRRKGRRLEGLARPRPLEPHTDTEWRGFTSTLRLLGDWSADAEMLLTLTGGAGLRAEEVVRASGDWIEIESATKVNLIVPAKDGTFRTVPLIDEPARILANWVHRHDGVDTLLFRPAFKTRANAISSLKHLLQKQFPEWRAFNAEKARYRWLDQLLTSAVPFQMVCQIAGIGIDSNLPTDLLANMRPSSTDNIRRALKSAANPSRKAA
jgi:hypothetical protein